MCEIEQAEEGVFVVGIQLPGYFFRLACIVGGDQQLAEHAQCKRGVGESFEVDFLQIP